MSVLYHCTCAIPKYFPTLFLLQATTTKSCTVSSCIGSLHDSMVFWSVICTVVKRLPLLLTLKVQIFMLVLKHAFTCSSVGSPNVRLLMQSSKQKVLTENRESCVSRNVTKTIICHTLDDATVCSSQTIYSKCAAAG